MTVLNINRRALLSGSLASLVGLRQAQAQPSELEDLERVPLGELIGRMVMMGFRGDAPESAGARACAEWLRKGTIGGIIFFDDNLRSPAQAKRLIGSLRQAAGSRPTYFAVDQEGGSIVRMRPERGFEPLPAAQAMATTVPPEAAAKLYERAARQMSELEINLNFGPVVDLALNDRSWIIKALGRSYGSDPDVVANYARAFVDAHRRFRISTAIKHFPGHGSTAADSHSTLPDISATWRKEELRPFAVLTNSGYADMVMVGHLVHRDLTEPGTPASLSKRAIQGLLRDDIGYQGVVVSDDMQMGALRRNFSADDAILKGVEAGIDLFVYSNREHPDREMPGRFHRVLTQAVESNRLPRARLIQSARRLARLLRAQGRENVAFRR